MDTSTSSMRPFVVKDLVQTVMDRKAMSFDDAVSYVYSSDLYMKLLDEDAKMWYWSTATLYDMLEEEKYYKRRKKVTGKKLMFRVFCLEAYCDKLDMRLGAGLSAALKGRVMISAGKKPYFAVKIDRKGGKDGLDTLREALETAVAVKAEMEKESE